MANLVRFNPLGGVVSLQDEVNDLFRDFFRGVDTLGAANGREWAPAVDIEETEDSFVVTADVPGMTQKDIKITLNDGVLTLSGERKQEKTDKKRGSHRVERFHGMFTRSFALPTSVDAEKVKATYREGVLSVNLPKREEAKPKQIEVKVE
jgi:HSP20 family protein